jgi:hypothetical protein
MAKKATRAARTEPRMTRSALLPGAAAVAILIAGVVAAAEVSFAPGDEHPWNHLHRLLYVRTLPDGKTSAYQGLEAPLGREGSFLIEGPSHRQALARLDDFLRTDADRLVKDPLRRALLQRDLWYVFDKTAEPPSDNSLTDAEDHQAERRALQKRLAQVMRRLELSEQEIAALPDNYAEAVRSGTFPRIFDAEHPDRAFLPPDLLGAASPWVPLQRFRERLAAPEHVRFTGGRSVFVVLLRLLGGRQATEKYIAELRQNEGVRQFPPGTQVALLRRLVLVNDRGALQLTPLTEELQLRAFPRPADQHSYEVSLARDRLLAGKTGGLRALGPEDDDQFFFRSSAAVVDPFEGRDRPRTSTQPLATCRGCHQSEPGGVFTMTTLGMGRVEGYQGGERGDFAEQVRQTLLYKKGSHSWGLLQGLRESGTSK